MRTYTSRIRSIAIIGLACALWLVPNKAYADCDPGDPNSCPEQCTSYCSGQFYDDIDGQCQSDATAECRNDWGVGVLYYTTAGSSCGCADQGDPDNGACMEAPYCEWECETI